MCKFYYVYLYNASELDFKLKSFMTSTTNTQMYIPTYGHDHGVFLGITVQPFVLQSLQYGSASIKSLHALYTRKTILSTLESLHAKICIF